jgi:hypothetical protein
LKLNFIGIIGGILGFVSLALPWWTASISAYYGASFSADISVYLYQVTAFGQSTTPTSDYWYVWAALALVLTGSVLALVGSVITFKRRVLLGLAGALVLAGVVLFPVALQWSISNAEGLIGQSAPAGVGVFSSGSYGQGAFSASYMTYLTFGFWIALTGAVLMLVAATRKAPEATPAAAPSTTPTSPPMQP